MTGNRDGWSGRFHSLMWLVVPILVMGFVVWDAIVRSRHILRVTAGYGVTVDAPLIDARSPTGYEHGVRSMLLPEAGEDTAHWVMQTQTMIARGEWRLRRVDYDNAPAGRELHWAAPFHWWLGLLAWIDHLASGRPIGVSVEHATLTYGAVMFALLLASLMPLLSRRFSPAAAALAAIGAVATSTFYTDFLPGRADHHGLVNICALFMVLFMAIGSTRASGAETSTESTDQRERRAAQRWFIGSALAGGLGLWISAATIIPVLIGLGLGVLAASWGGRGRPQRFIWLRVPGLFRLWGLTGGAVSLIAYLFEYFPSHLGLRLEVNHPLYAAAWIGGGELLRLAVGAIGQVRPLTRRDLATGAIGAALVVLAPVVILATSAKSFVLLDPFVWQLHKSYIAEEQGFMRLLASKAGEPWSIITLCLPLLLLVAPVVMALRPSTARETKADLALVLGPAMVAWIQSWSQVRWLSLAYALAVPAVAIFFRALEASGEKSRRLILGWFVAGGLLFVPGAVKAVRQTLAGAEFTKEEIRHLAQRDVAHWLRLRAGDEPVVVASAPTNTTILISQGGLAGLDTLYWENTEGLKNAAALFAAPSPAAAHELVRRLGVTHLVFFSWDPFEVTLAKLARGVSADAPIPTDTFIALLLGSIVPPAWLRAIPFTLPDHPSLEGEQVRIWEVMPDQTSAEATAQAANYYLETGKPDPAGRLASALAGFDRDLASSVMLAGLQSRQQDAAAFSAAMERVLAQRPQAESLPLEDHVHLVVVLAVGQRPELAREQLRSAMKKVNEPSLRHLTPGTLTDLLSLGDGLGVDWPDPVLKRLAERLVPPIRRK